MTKDELMAIISEWRTAENNAVIAAVYKTHHSQELRKIADDARRKLSDAIDEVMGQTEVAK